MSKAWLWVGAGLLVASTTFAGAPPAPLDLTGIWKGEQICAGYDGSKFADAYKNDTMYVSQQGDRLQMGATCDGGDLPGDLATCQVIYKGFVINSEKDPDRKGQAAFNSCVTGSWFLYEEVVRATKLELKKDADADMEGLSIFSYYSFTHPDYDNVATCTWKYHRVSTVDPQVPDCRHVVAPSTAPITDDPVPRKLPQP